MQTNTPKIRENALKMKLKKKAIYAKFNFGTVRACSPLADTSVAACVPI
jgi:hypothetical protein